jgi:hypothetical protein
VISHEIDDITTFGGPLQGVIASTRQSTWSPQPMDEYNMPMTQTQEMQNQIARFVPILPAPLKPDTLGFVGGPQFMGSATTDLPLNSTSQLFSAGPSQFQFQGGDLDVDNAHSDLEPSNYESDYNATSTNSTQTYNYPPSSG